MKKIGKKILFTGGHYNSALATLDWLHQSNKTYRFIWIGQKNKSYPEYNDVSKRDVRIYRIHAGKLFRSNSIRYLPQVIYNLILVPIGFIQSLFIIAKEKPDLIVSFGGFIALPVVICGYILGIKSVTHEQTTVLGLANSIIARFVDKIFISWDKSIYNISDNIKKKMLFTGLPVRQSLLHLSSVEKYKFKSVKPVVYISGGKTGATYINKTIEQHLDMLTEHMNIIWSIGTNTYISKDTINGYDGHLIYKKYFSESEIAKVFKTADFTVSRGGAHTMYEVILLNKPCIIIPILLSSNNEQLKNAQYVEKAGLGKVIDESTTSSKQLADEIVSFAKIYKKYTLIDKYIVTDGTIRLGNELINIIET